MGTVTTWGRRTLQLNQLVSHPIVGFSHKGEDRYETDFTLLENKGVQIESEKYRFIWIITNSGIRQSDERKSSSEREKCVHLRAFSGLGFG